MGSKMSEQIEESWGIGSEMDDSDGNVVWSGVVEGWEDTPPVDYR